MAPFSGELSMSAQEFADLVLALNELEGRAKYADFYKDLYYAEKEKREQLEEKLKKLEAEF